MARTVSIGTQRFEILRQNNNFYVDKTYFIKELWENEDPVTLITRPRRFGKTLNMDMLNCFFSNKFADRSDLFEGLSIWREEKYRQLQGTYPVINLSFADVKQTNLKDAKHYIKSMLGDIYKEHRYLLEDNFLTEGEKEQFHSVGRAMDDDIAHRSLKTLCEYLYRYYGRNTIILLDEYDTPMQEAYVGGYWDEFTGFIRALFNAAFKTNSYLQKAVLTGITRVSKESIFSDLNNLMVITTMSRQYSTCFGFTEEEVFDALEEQGLSEEKAGVKAWYDGFTFGNQKDIYNPWSVTSFLKNQEYGTYWADTRSNKLINTIVQKSSADVKKAMEHLIKGEVIETVIEEQMVFDQLDYDEEAIFSLMLASGYLKVDHMVRRDENGEPLGRPVYFLKLTNKEVSLMFSKLFSGWFAVAKSSYNGFVRALLAGNLKEMNRYMQEVVSATISSFDTGKKPSKRKQPERFYHGLVLGLLVELRGQYDLISNGESGFGRYDIMLIPLKPQLKGIIIEFKVREEDEGEKDLSATVLEALKQIEEKQYDIRLLERGVRPEEIVHYGFAFEGKKVRIGAR